MATAIDQKLYHALLQFVKQKFKNFFKSIKFL
jgi:hypothetical protein